jgi:flagellar basal-body rod protein FlgG
MSSGYDMAAYMGARAERLLTVVSHNLANAATAGFKRELVNLWRLPPEAPHQAAAYVDVICRDLGQGAMQVTGGDTDLAIDGPGFFKVETPQGVRYTRNGAFGLNADRQLVTKEGYLVLGKGGPVTLNALDQQFAIDEEGGVHLDNSLADQILVVDFDHPQDLRPQGQTYFALGPEAGEEREARGARVLQGMLEASNIDPVSESVKLITIQRGFEAYLKVLETFTANDRKVVEEVGQG